MQPWSLPASQQQTRLSASLVLLGLVSCHCLRCSGLNGMPQKRLSGRAQQHCQAQRQRRLLAAQHQPTPRSELSVLSLRSARVAELALRGGRRTGCSGRPSTGTARTLAAGWSRVRGRPGALPLTLVGASTAKSARQPPTQLPGPRRRHRHLLTVVIKGVHGPGHTLAAFTVVGSSGATWSVTPRQRSIWQP